MADKKKKVEVEISETPVETAEEPATEAAVEVRENDKPILVAETEPEVKTDEAPAEAIVETPPPTTDTSQIFGPTAPEPPASNKKLFWILIVVFALLGAGAGGVGIYLQNRSSSPVPQPSPSLMAVVTPTPTPVIELNREDLVVQVLNGSGVTGAAATARDFLEELGYVDVATGNAASSDYATTQIAIKDSQKDYLSLVKSDLEDRYTLADEVETLDEDGDYDVVITLGKE